MHSGLTFSYRNLIMKTLLSAVNVLALLVLAPVLAEDTPAEPQTIKPEEAVYHAGETCRVQFEVKASRLLRDQKIVFLNSRANYQDEENFTVVIFSAGLKKFQENNIADPAAHYKDKTILVTGGVTLRSGKAQIKVDNPEQITVVTSEEGKTP